MYGYHQGSFDTCGDGGIDVKGDGVRFEKVLDLKVHQLFQMSEQAI